VRRESRSVFSSAGTCIDRSKPFTLPVRQLIRFLLYILTVKHLGIQYKIAMKLVLPPLFAPALLSSALLMTFFSCGSEKSLPIVAPRIIAVIPHDSSAFTQGLFFDNGRLYESDGLYGKSAIRILDAQNGALVKHVPLDSRYFGEGCATMEETIVQLTWQEQTALTYSRNDLSPEATLVYSGEGWGLTSDGRQFYMSNGSDTIFVRNREFTIVRKIPVTSHGLPVKNINELEYVKGTVFANVWYSDSILEINPENGRVEKIIDCSALVKKERPSSSEGVLNGIAYNSGKGEYYLTGKKWKNIFIVEIPGK
jgi:glutamine cyclotransferase